MNENLSSPESSLKIPAISENLPQAITFISDFARSHHFSDLDINHLEIACEEAFINIASHAYADAALSGEVEIKCFYNNQTPLRVIFIDNGVAFTPPENREPNITAPAEERDIGGLGIFFMHSLMDKVTYSRKNDQNFLQIEKSKSKI